MDEQLRPIAYERWKEWEKRVKIYDKFKEACKNGSLETIKQLYDENNHDVPIENCIYEAIETGRADIAIYLLKLLNIPAMNGGEQVLWSFVVRAYECNTFKKSAYTVAKYILAHKKLSPDSLSLVLNCNGQNLSIIYLLKTAGAKNEIWSPSLEMWNRLINRHLLRYNADILIEGGPIFSERKTPRVRRIMRGVTNIILFNLMPACNDVKIFNMRFVGLS